MNIFIRELKANLKSLLIWAGVVIAFMFMGMTEFQAYQGNPEMLEILDSFPPALMDAMQMNAFNLTTITGFYGYMASFFALMLAVSAVMLGSDIISKEERDKTVEFSLTLPITREKLITRKIFAAVVYCIVLNLITWGGAVVTTAKYNPDSQFYEFLSLSMMTIFIIQMIFLTVGVFLGCVMKHHKRAGSTAIGVLLGTYFLSIIVGLSDKLDWLKHFSPFTYFNPADLLHKSEINMNNVFLSLSIIIVFLVGGYVTYSKRDLYI